MFVGAPIQAVSTHVYTSGSEEETSSLRVTLSTSFFPCEQ